MTKVNIIGGGLSGCECAYQLLKRGVEVNMFEMKPKNFTPAHKLNTLAELVCSNSLKSNDILSACGLLKQELRELDSLLIKIADSCSFPAGSSLSVDRIKFSEQITEELKKFKNFNLINEEIKDIPLNETTIIATGPLTSNELYKSLSKLVGKDNLYFFDAIAPIVDANSLDKDNYFVADRYGKGSPDYINCPLNKQEYDLFYNELINANTIELKDFEDRKVFEGCMAVEIIAKRGYDALRFGCMKPVGLIDPKTNNIAFACVQLRKESFNNNLYNIVGFQTNLKYGEQERVFKIIPALKNAEFLRFGTMHKNIYINSPNFLNQYFQVISNPNLFIAGQLSGVEGYVESIASGLMVGINVYNYLNGKIFIDFPQNSMMGALSNYIAHYNSSNFQPMSSNMGLINNDGVKIKDKKEKNKFLSERAINEIKNIKQIIKE